MITAYDQIPYPIYAYSVAHPDTLATVATLLGLDPAPVEHCRVLELGCAGGGHLIPMALGLPDSQFVGIDYAARQIADGQMAAQALDLSNIELRHMDIMDTPPDLGPFDYIIAHGIFSWVPKPVQEKILDICQAQLAPHGVAYVSYNTYPGWHMLGAARQMMLYHTRHVTDPHMRAAQARALIEFLAEAVPSDEKAGGLLPIYSGLLKKELERWKETSDAYLLHEELEEINEPMYFYQFAERAASHGLQYLCEAEFGNVFPNRFPPQVTEQLMKLSHNIIEMEQYMDFLRNETFRRTCLVHDQVSFSRSVKLERVRHLHVSSRAEPASTHPDLHSISEERFRLGDSLTLTTDHPATKAALVYLREVWPAIVPFDALLDAAYAKLGLAPPPQQRALDAHVMSASLLKAFTYSGKLVELHHHVPRFVTQAGERPVASPWARFMARDSLQVTNLRHECVELRESDRYLLLHLDGAHDRAALFEGLSKQLAQGTLVIERSGQPIQDTAEAQKLLAEEIEQALDGFAHAALLLR